LEGTAGELANGQTITGFSVGDVIDLTGFAATSSSYTAGTGLVLSNATASETLGFTGGDPSFVVSGDGNGGTDIFGVTHTLATTSTLGITLTATGPYVSPFTVTQTGTIASTYGVYSALSAAYLPHAERNRRQFRHPCQ
jgi:hypothetical protein